MRRRESTHAGVLPAALETFRSTAWPGRDEAERYGKWLEARRVWADAQRIVKLPDEAEADAAFPDGVFRLEDI